MAFNKMQLNVGDLQYFAVSNVTYISIGNFSSTGIKTDAKLILDKNLLCIEIYFCNRYIENTRTISVKDR